MRPLHFLDYQYAHSDPFNAPYSFVDIICKLLVFCCKKSALNARAMCHQSAERMGSFVFDPDFSL
jgi:hypothetical protein